MFSIYLFLGFIFFYFIKYYICLLGIIMAALWNRTDHYIFALLFLSSSYGRPME